MGEEVERSVLVASSLALSPRVSLELTSFPPPNISSYFFHIFLGLLRTSSSHSAFFFVHSLAWLVGRVFVVRRREGISRGRVLVEIWRRGVEIWLEVCCSRLSFTLAHSLFDSQP